MQRREMFVGGVVGGVVGITCVALSRPRTANAVPVAAGTDVQADQMVIQMRLALGATWPERLASVMSPDERQQLCAAIDHTKA